MNRTNLIKLTIACMCTFTMAFTFLSSAMAEYPERPITWIVPSSAGGGSDTTGRVLMPFLSKYLGNAEIAVVNKPGAGGAVGIKAAAVAKPDGYTIGQPQIPTLVSRQFENPDIGFNADSFEYIGNIVSDYFILTVPKDSEIKSFADYAKEAEAKKGDFICGVTSIGGSSHLATLKYMKETGVNTKLVPFGGGSKVRAALLGGHIPSGCSTSGAFAKVREKVNILAVASPADYPPVSGVPTFKSQGYDFTAGNHRALVVPKGTPAEIVEKLRAAMQKAMQDPEYIAAAKKAKLAPDYMTGQEIENVIRDMEIYYGDLWKNSPWVEKK